ncbi:MAG: Na+/H+ antiporter subunit E [Pseudolabrys sp.]
MRYFSLGISLFAFWLALSGHYTPFLITAGIGCAALCVYAAARIDLVDREGHPIHLLPAAALYFPWLIAEIGKSAWSVTRTILSPALSITPTVVTLKATQKTTEGITTYANSITLTPGTITVGVSGNELTVHALVKEGAEDLEAGGMDARVSRFERSA